MLLEIAWERGAQRIAVSNAFIHPFIHSSQGLEGYHDHCINIDICCSFIHSLDFKGLGASHDHWTSSMVSPLVGQMKNNF